MNPDQAIVVFGGSDWRRKSKFWRLGIQVGSFLAQRGRIVVTGGYGGAMEAVSQGAHEAGGEVHGILLPSEENRSANPYLTSSEIQEDYQARLAQLLRIPRAIALPGGSGTAAEVAVAIALLIRRHRNRLAVWKPFWFNKLIPLYENLQELAKLPQGLFWFEKIDDLDSIFIDFLRLPKR